MLDEFSVDIWFCYGSFSYGFESKIFSWEEDKLSLTLSSNNEEEADKLEDFFENITEKPKGLLRVELRIFGSDKVTKKHKMNFPIYLYTDIAPRPLQKVESKALLEFTSIKGISQSNTDHWNKLVRQIWTKTNSPKTSKKR